MRSLVLVMLAVVLLVTAAVIVLRDRHHQGGLNRLGLDELRRIYRSGRPR